MYRHADKALLTIHAAVTAQFFILIECIKAYRSSQWSGTTAFDLAGITLGFVGYWFVLGLFAGLFFALARRISPRISVRVYGPVFSSLAGLVLWGVLSVYREFSPTLDDAIVAGGLAGLAAGLAALGVIPRFGVWGAAAIPAIALLSGLTGLFAAGQYWLFEPGRANYVTVVPLGVAAAACVVSMIVYLLTTRRVIRVAVPVVLVLSPWLSCQAVLHRPAPEDRADRPNLIFVVSDTLRAKSLKLYGGTVAAPALNRMAGQGHVFDRAYSLAPWTLPSMTALFGSEYPPSLTPGVAGEVWTQQLWQYAVSGDREALAVTLHERGYATGAFTANAFLPVIPGMMDGFETRATAHPILLLPQGIFNHLPFLQDLLLVWAPPLANFRPHNTTLDITHYAEAFMKRHRNQPFYLWLHYIDPHAPYDPPAAYRTLAGSWPFFHPYSGGERWGIPILGPDYSVPEADRAYVASLYEGEVGYMDAFLGGIQNTVESFGLGDNTYLCFTSDHGEELWEHGRWGHGQSLHEELVHVPLLLSGPGIAPGRTETPVSALDLMPTLAGLLGVEPDVAWKGRDLGPALGGELLAPAPVFMQGTSNKAWPHPLQAVVVGEYKYIRELDTGAGALFHLPSDPGEKVSLLAQEPDRASAMAAELDAWMESFPAVFPAPEAAGPGGNAELFEELRGMGYLQ